MELQYYKPQHYKKRGYHDCPHNEGCRCNVKNCHNCGWHPNVAKARMQKVMQVRGGNV